MILEAVLFWSNRVKALILGHFDAPCSGGSGGPGVDVDVDLIAGVGGGHPHVLARVVAADGGRDCTTWVCDGQGVRQAVSSNWA